eukprot:SAG22_NODE_4959_length_1122_cov_1.563050_3_plen_41_part_01
MTNLPKTVAFSVELEGHARLLLAGMLDAAVDGLLPPFDMPS